MKVSDTILKRVYFLFGFFVLFACLIIFQVLHLQWFETSKWDAERMSERVYYRKVLADRGSVLSDDGSILAITIPFYRPAIDATVIKEHNFANYDDSLNALCETLSKTFAKNDSTLDSKYFKNLIITAKAREDRHCYIFPIKRLLNFQEMKLIKTLPIFNRGKYKGGLIIEKVNNQRFYPFDKLGRITLGLMKDDTTGLRGIEYSFNKELRGRDGTTLVQRLAGNIELPINEFGEEDALDGRDVVTTLNISMQDIVSQALQRGMEKHVAKSGVAILMETNTGKIKAIANYPENFNYAVNMPVEPGSTFKIASAMVALEDGVVKPTDTIHTGNGEAKYSDRTLKDVTAYGDLTFKQVFEKSSNVGIAKVINDFYGNQPQRFIQQLEKIGAIAHTGSQLQGEPTPYIIRPGNPEWNTTTIPWLSTGYNVLLTPLQMLTFVNAIANNGKMLQPIIVSQIRNNSEVEIKFKAAVLREKICSEQTLATMREFMEGVVNQGSATSIKTHFAIAGKTGTTKKSVQGEYKTLYRSSFVGYFPADKPRYSCIVMLDEPMAGDIYGSAVAAPVFKEIAEKIMSADIKMERESPLRTSFPDRSWDIPVTRLVNQQDAKIVYNQLNITTPNRPSTDYSYCKRTNYTVSMNSYKVRKWEVPDVVGMPAKDALAVLENIGMKVKMTGNGVVHHQSLGYGARYRRGDGIHLTMGD